ncbi:sugar transferase [Paracerasibacillus soli]|uniref:sugar transferase n=1 Tax=Paracerasibacillus soli TaxID=480284 RepID=UPI00387E185F
MSKILFRFLKRVCDMLVSMCLLLILSPVMVIIAVILYKKEGGPIIFRELRIGKDQRTYMMYVFRTTSKPTLLSAHYLHIHFLIVGKKVCHIHLSFFVMISEFIRKLGRCYININFINYLYYGMC